MDTGLLVALVAVAALGIALAVIATKARANYIILEEVRSDLKIARSDAVALQEAIRDATAEGAASEARLLDAEKTIGALRQERDSAYVERDKARLTSQELEKQTALARNDLAAIERRLTDWEQARQENFQHAKAAILEVGQTLSTKLISDHKQETEAAKKVAEERLQETTKALNDQFSTVVRSLASLNDQVARNRDMTDTVWRALSSPGGAGHFAEIGLENCLKSFGLERDRDFMIQHTIGGDGETSRLRPDATVLLPFDSVLVIDSKASKFLLELADAEGTEAEEAAYINLARTMNSHLRSLANKDYRSAILASCRDAGRSGEIRRILNVMYLPNDAAFEKINRADPEFPKKALRAEIIVVGPTLLAALIGFARVEIDVGRQAENQERIVQTVQGLLESIGIVMSHTEGVGKGIKAAAENFAKLTASINTRLLPRTRHVMQLGVRPTKNKPIPITIPSYQVIALDNQTIIEGEGEEIAPSRLADQRDAS